MKEITNHYPSHSKSNISLFKSAPIKIGMPNYPPPSSRGYLKGHYPAKKHIPNQTKEPA